MFKFAKPDRTSFPVGYNGDIACFDSDGKLIASCMGIAEGRVAATPIAPLDPEEAKLIVGTPYEWEDWIIHVTPISKPEREILQRMVTNAFGTCVLVERYIKNIRTGE